LYSLELLREWQYKQLCIQISSLGYRREEPESVAREQSQLLRRAFELLKQKGLSRHEVANAIDVDVRELDRLVFGLQIVPLRGNGTSTSPKPPKLQVLNGGK
jgi:hypothetical protein